MTWARPAPDRIESAAGTVLRCSDGYYAWGPDGSQDVSYIAAATAHVLRQIDNIKRDPAMMQITRGCEFLGRHSSEEAAKTACETRGKKGAAA
jgi:hypothetical protein